MTPGILGNSFSEKRNKPLDFLRRSTARGTVLRLGFPERQGDVNVLILVVGPRGSPRRPRDTAVSVCSSGAYGRRGLLRARPRGTTSHPPQELTFRAGLGFLFVFWLILESGIKRNG